jgi:hypothetical protein
MIFMLLSMAASGLQASNLWRLSKNEIPHLRIFTAYVLYMGIELWLALRDPAQRGLLWFVLLDVWCAAMAIKGWLAYKKNLATTANS